MITNLSSKYVDENMIINVFQEVLDLTLKEYSRMGDYQLEPMGNEQDMQKNLPNIAGCILRACQTYYNTPEEQLVQIISSITVNHYLENGNKRTAVSAGVLYLLSHAVKYMNELKEEMFNWVIGKMQHLKKIADSFAKHEIFT